MNYNKGLRALTTPDEFEQVVRISPFGPSWTSKNHDPKCNLNHPRVVFGFWQDDFQGGKIAYWHVLHDNPYHHSTISMQGLKDYRIL